MCTIITEEEFQRTLHAKIKEWQLDEKHFVRSVTGPGRSGAIAAAYVSHYLGISFIPCGQPCPEDLRPILVVDTAEQTGQTLRKAVSKYARDAKDGTTFALSIFHEPPRIKFWYENQSEPD